VPALWLHDVRVVANDDTDTDTDTDTHTHTHGKKKGGDGNDDDVSNDDVDALSLSVNVWSDGREFVANQELMKQLSPLPISGENIYGLFCFCK
jgi:hypothetical protein